MRHGCDTGSQDTIPQKYERCHKLIPIEKANS
jgi:hypothetical protein